MRGVPPPVVQRRQPTCDFRSARTRSRRRLKLTSNSKRALEVVHAVLGRASFEGGLPCEAPRLDREQPRARALGDLRTAVIRRRRVERATRERVKESLREARRPCWSGKPAAAAFCSAAAISASAAARSPAAER